MLDEFQPIILPLLLGFCLGYLTACALYKDEK